MNNNQNQTQPQPQPQTQNQNQNSFISNENKGLLWEMMMTNNMFDGVANDNFENVKTMFENVIMRIGHGIRDDGLSRDRLLSLNKTAILEIKTNLNIFKKRNNEDTIDNEKVLVFDKSLDNLKTDFMETIALKRPVEPEFTDKMDTPIENMNELLERLEREREQLLPPNPKQETENDVKPKLIIKEIEPTINTNTNTNTNTNINSKKLSSIDELFSLGVGVGESQSTKQVTFLEDSPLSSLPETMKQKPDSVKNIAQEELIGERRINSEIKLSNILEILREIDRKQTEILRLLKTT